MIIIPVMKKMVDQLMPELALSEAPYQKSARKIAPRFRAFLIASQLCMQMPNTTTSTRAALPRVTYWRSNLSMMMSANMPTKMTAARI